MSNIAVIGFDPNGVVCATIFWLPIISLINPMGLGRNDALLLDEMPHAVVSAFLSPILVNTCDSRPK